MYLPLVMADSGHFFSSGPDDYVAAYRSMVNTALPRAPQAAVAAWARRVGNALRVYATVTNLAGTPLSSANEATVNALVWEEARVGVTSRYVRAAPSAAIPGVLEPGGKASFVLDAALPSSVNWSKVHAVAVAEYRPGGRAGPYDMLQAAAAAVPALTATPAQLALQAVAGRPDRSRGTLSLAGPQVVSWTVSSGAPWLSATPAAGSLPAEVEVAVDGTSLEPGSHTADLVFSGASADGLALSSRVTVTVERIGSRRPLRVRISGTG